MFNDFSHSFYYGALFLAAVLSLVFYRRLNTPFLLIAVLIWLSLGSELIAKYVAYGLNHSNNIVYHIFTPIEFGLYLLIYNTFLREKNITRILILIFIIFVFFEIVNTLLWQGIHQSNTNTIILESVLLVGLSLLQFLKIKEAPMYQNLLSEGIFWFNSIVLVYYSFNIMVWGFHNLRVYNLVNPPTLMYDMNLIFSGILYMTFFIAIYLSIRSKPYQIISL